MDLAEPAQRHAPGLGLSLGRPDQARDGVLAGQPGRQEASALCRCAPVALPSMSEQPVGRLTLEQQKAMADILQRLVQSPEVQRAMRTNVESLRRALDTSDSYARMRVNAQRIAGGVTAPIAARVNQILEASMRVNLEPLRRAVKVGTEVFLQFFPPNIRALPGLWPHMANLAANEQLCLVWAARAEIVEEIVAAPDREEREKVLLAHGGRIVDDCRAAVVVVTPELQDVVKLLQRAYHAHDAGHHESAQALATCVLDSMLEQVLAAGEGKILGVIKGELRETETKQMTAMVLRDTLAACQSALKTKGTWGQEPDGYLRNASVHAASTSVYTPVNALKAILLATSVACMLSHPLTAFRRIREIEAGYQLVEVGR